MLEQAKLIVFVCNRRNKQQNLVQASNTPLGTSCLQREIETKLKELVGAALWSKAESFTQIYINQRQRARLQKSTQQQQQQFVQTQLAPNRLGQLPFQDNSQVVQQMTQQSDDAIKRVMFQMEFPPSTPLKNCHPFDPVPVAFHCFTNRAEV